MNPEDLFRQFFGQHGGMGGMGGMSCAAHGPRLA